jgi:hypothetical protein
MLLCKSDERRARGADAQSLCSGRAPNLSGLYNAHTRKSRRLKLERPERLSRRRDDYKLDPLVRGLRAQVPDGLAYQVETAGRKDKHRHLRLEAQTC